MRGQSGGAVAACATVLIGLMLSGCCATWGTGDLSELAFDDAGAGYQRVAIRYRVDAQQRNLPVAFAHVEGPAVTYESRPGTNGASHALGQLEIIYPHPSGRVGYCLARVTIGDAINGARATGDKSGLTSLVSAGKNAETVSGHESWEMDITKAEMDRLIGRLREAQFFGPYEYSQSGVELTTHLDGDKTTKSWNQVPEFDALVLRVRRDGLLVSYQREENIADEGDDDGVAGKLAEFFAPLTGTEVTAPVPIGYANETSQPFRAGSRFAPSWPGTSIARAPKKRLANDRVVRLPIVDPIGMFAPHTNGTSSTGGSTMHPADDRLLRLPSVVQ